MKKTSLWLTAIVGLQVAWMIGTSLLNETHLARSSTVLLETAPVDPRDLLRGDFVILNYKISSISTTLFAEPPPPPEQSQPALGRTVYVLLEPRGEFYEAVSASLNPLQPATGQSMIRGTTDANQWRWQPNTVRITYGIEKYYVAEGTGNPQGKLTVAVALKANGQAMIKNVFVDGKPYKEAVQPVSRR